MRVFNPRHRLVHLVATGGADMNCEAQQVGGLQPGVGHVVAVAHPSHHFALEAIQGVVHVPTVLNEGE